MLSIADTIRVGDLSTAYAGNYNAQGALFGPRLNPVSATNIAIVTDALRFQYEGNPTDTTLRGVANYLYWMCGVFGLQAQGIIGGTGGGTVTPGGIPGPVPLPIQFIVTETSFMVGGQSNVQIPQFIGYNILFTRGGIQQSDITTENSYYQWDKVTGLFSVSPAAQFDELFQIYAV